MKNISDVLAHLLMPGETRSARRAAWPEDWRGIYYVPSRLMQIGCEAAYLRLHRQGEIAPWSPTTGDLYADDWVFSE